MILKLKPEMEELLTELLERRRPDSVHKQGR